MADYIYPESAELVLIAQDKMARLTADRPIFSWMPIQEQDAHLVMWEQKDNYAGLQQVRGLNGEAPKVQKIGMRRFQMEPGVYGEHIPIDEIELTVRRQYGSFNSPINISDLVMDAQDQLLQRRLDRIEAIGWNLVVNGTFSVYNETGALVHTDSYTTQTFTAGTAWSTASTSTPLADLRSVQLDARGHSVRFDASAEMFMNLKTWNNMLSNTNAADIGGRRTTGLETINGPDQMRRVLMQDNLPNLNIYDEGYLSHVNGGQTVTITGVPTGGTFLLSYRGVFTATIAYNDTAATVQTRLNAISTIGTSGVTVSGAAGGPYTVLFTGAQFQGPPTDLLIANGNALTGGTNPAVTVAAITAGSASTFQPFIPDSTVVVVGKRPAGQPVGAYKMTRNANNPNLAPGAYQRVIDHGEDKIPRLIEVHDGHNGGPALYFPSAIVTMSV